MSCQTAFNALFPTKDAGYVTADGYLRVRVANKALLVHRIAFLLFHGFEPDEVDHIDGNKINNKIENLRAATHGQNMHNKTAPKNNTSGVKGVYFHKDCKKWIASCTVNKKSNYIGSFLNIEDAEKAVKAFREKAHAEFANHKVKK